MMYEGRRREKRNKGKGWTKKVNRREGKCKGKYKSCRLLRRSEIRKEQMYEIRGRGEVIWKRLE